MTNRYPGKCIACGSIVPANGGILRKSKRGRWYVKHLCCEDDRGHSVEYRFSGSDNVVYQNSRGRCEDAPCCGCCT